MTRPLSYGYDAHGPRSGLSGGIASSVGYDGIGRLASLSHGLAGTAADVSYGYDLYNPASQILSLTRSNDGYAWTEGSASTLAYVVNGLNQYTSVGGTAPGVRVADEVAVADAMNFTATMGVSRLARRQPRRHRHARKW